LQSLYFSPKRPTANGVIWGVGPVLRLRTAIDEAMRLPAWPPRSLQRTHHGNRWCGLRHATPEATAAA